MDFDPSVISYARLLEVFWNTHSPCTRASRQYMSIIFFHNEEQKRLAFESKSRFEAARGRVTTEIVPAGVFTMAEDYHQKYELRHNEGLMRELARLYPDPAELVASTAAARLNGFLGGHARLSDLVEEFRLIGLSDADKKRLLSQLPGHDNP